MNWIKENKFLTGFIAVMLIAVGVLGYEVWSAYSAYDEATDNYTKASGEYSRLRHLAPFPNKQNLEGYEVQKEEAGKVITAFEADLATKEFPLEPISPEKFQDQLKASVTTIRKKAEENGIKLPEKFYLGFSKYETTPPSNEAAPPLSRELKAIEWVMSQYLSHPASQMNAVAALDRIDLPEEKVGKGSGSSGKAGSGSAFGGPGGSGSGGGGPGGSSKGGKGPPGGPGGGGGGFGTRGLVQYHPFDVTVLCKQQALIEVLKAITSAKAPQFFVLRQIRIKSSNEKAPPRVSPDAAKPEDKDTVKYIVGEEWVDITIRWEVVDFTSPAEKSAAGQVPPAAKPGKPGPEPKSLPAPAGSLTPAAVSTPPTSLISAATPTPPANPAPAAAPASPATPAPTATPASPASPAPAATSPPAATPVPKSTPAP